MKLLRDVAIGIALWALGLFVFGVVARMNWEIFLFGWNSL